MVLETLALSILNHDCAIASAAARMVTAAAGRPIIEMGSRRTHEQAAVAAARAAYLAGFASTSNLEAARRYGVPTAGTAAHAFTLLHDDERAAFAAQVDALGPGTTLLVDTYDITRGIELAVEVAGPGARARSASTPATSACWPGTPASSSTRSARPAPASSSAATSTSSRSPRSARRPVDSYGAGTAVVTGSGAPTAGMVYKLVEVDGRPVAKRSEHKESHGGRKTALRAHKPTGTAIEEIVRRRRRRRARRGRAAAAAPAGARRRSRWPTCRPWPSRATTCARRR